jgi:membrane-bound inhibitor of C-type lysozyme
MTVQLVGAVQLLRLALGGVHIECTRQDLDINASLSTAEHQQLRVHTKQVTALDNHSHAGQRYQHGVYYLGG